MTRLQFIWHFHQPYYGLPNADEFILPWVRLHGVKSYYDMGRLLERRPRIRATFNFSGSLIRQLVEYADTTRRDRWWRWSITDPGDLTAAQRRGIVRHFFSLDVDRHIEPNERYRALYRRRRDDGVHACADDFDAQQLLDLQVLFNLAWCGFSAAEDFPIVQRLRDKGRDFTVDERDELLAVHQLIVSKILPLYGDLVSRHQIEVCVSPMYHPILPLLIDTDTARRAAPDRPLPAQYCAPASARRQLVDALDAAETAFGERPTGVWPSEGSISPETIELLDDCGVEWTAGDEQVLRKSRTADWQRSDDLFRPWQLCGTGPRIYFRDHDLSDRIGFVYADNPASEAADDFVEAVSEVGDGRCVSVILDGENPWEHYENDGRDFLTALYDRLETATEIETTTPSDTADLSSGRLGELHSGSWINADFAIWIGHRETNTGWEWLRRADHCLRRTAEKAPDHPGLSEAEEHLRIAQGSDWFWWYGDDFTSVQDAEFDALFRALVAGVWTSLGEAPSSELSQPICRDGSRDESGLQLTPPTRYIRPTTDGRSVDYFDWVGAGAIHPSGAHGSMYETLQPLKAIRYGFSPDRFFLRLEPGDDFSGDSEFDIRLILDDTVVTTRLGPDIASPEHGVYDEVAELSICLDEFHLDPGDRFDLVVDLHRAGLQIMRIPPHDTITIEVPDADPGLRHWLV